MFYTRAGHAENADQLAGFRLERNFIQHGRLGPITKRDEIEQNSSSQTRRRDCARMILDFKRCVENFKDAPRCGETLLNRIGNRGKIGDLAVELLEQSGEHHKSAAQCDLALNIKPAAISEQNHQAGIRKLNCVMGVKMERSQKMLLLLRGHFVIAFLEPAHTTGFGGKTFYGLNAEDALRKKLDQIVVKFAVSQVTRSQPARIIMRQEGQRHCNGKTRKRQRRMNVPHENKIRHERDEHVQALENDAVHEETGVLDIAGEAVEDGTGTVHLEETETEALKFGVKFVAQIGHDFSLRQPRCGHVVTVSQHGAQQCPGQQLQVTGRSPREWASKMSAVSNRKDKPARPATDPTHGE